MDRRSFLKSLAAITGVSVVPDITFAFPMHAEPAKWIVEYNVYEDLLQVAAQWGNGSSLLRHAVSIPMRDGVDQGQAIAYCKQAIRQWYVNRQLRKAA